VTAFASVMIVEDDAALAKTIKAALATWTDHVHACQRASDAIALLGRVRPELILLDVALPDGTAFDVLNALAAIEPCPMVVAMSGSAQADESFRLAQLGVRSYLRKPFNLEELQAALTVAKTAPADLRPHVRNLVGLRPIHEVEDELRRTMLQEALARARGSRRGAARILAVSRQLLQHMLRKWED
jgi:two-component system, response regulator RegA